MPPPDLRPLPLTTPPDSTTQLPLNRHSPPTLLPPLIPHTLISFDPTSPAHPLPSLVHAALPPPDLRDPCPTTPPHSATQLPSTTTLPSPFNPSVPHTLLFSSRTHLYPSTLYHLPPVSPCPSRPPAPTLPTTPHSATQLPLNCHTPLSFFTPWSPTPSSSPSDPTFAAHPLPPTNPPPNTHKHAVLPPPDPAFSLHSTLHMTLPLPPSPRPHVAPEKV